MPTPCMNPEPHRPHPWAIAANPGEPGPDHFQCAGRDGELVRWEATGEIPLGRVNTDRWVVPETGWYRLRAPEYWPGADTTEYQDDEPTAYPGPRRMTTMPDDLPSYGEVLDHLLARENCTDPHPVDDDQFVTDRECGNCGHKMSCCTSGAPDCSCHDG